MNTSTVYLATFNDLRKSTDGGNTWTLTPLVREPDSGLSGRSREGPFVDNLLIDPLNTSTLYAGTTSGIFKSTDGARTWTSVIVDPARSFFYLRGIDPGNTGTLYAIAYSNGPLDVYKSLDGGSTWRVIGRIDDGAGTLSIDPANPSLIYANTYAGQLRSTDGGVSWNPLPLGNLFGKVSIHPQSSALYFTTQTEADAFVAKVSPDGTSLMSSTFLGGYGYDSGLSVAVDAMGNVYAAGESWSGNFPTRPAAFSDAYGGGAQDSFIIKFGAPKITGASLNRKELSIAGDNFDKEAAILLNGKQQKTERDDRSQVVVLVSRKAGKRIAVGEQVVIQVKNSDGTLSKPFSFTRPAGQ